MVDADFQNLVLKSKYVDLKFAISIFKYKYLLCQSERIALLYVQWAQKAVI